MRFFSNYPFFFRSGFSIGRKYLFLVFLFPIISCTNLIKQKPVKFTGETQGTYYAITYFDEQHRDFQKDIEVLLANFDTIASMWVDSSMLSKINRNEAIKVDDHFKELFAISKHVYENTQGSFDPTVGPLVNVWGFGFTDRMHVDQKIVDSLLPLVGFDQVKIENDRVVKKDIRIQIDFNAIAQGYSVDLVARFLQKKGIYSYMLDIGGEVMAHGRKPDGSPWKVGIEKPADNAAYGQSLQAIIRLNNKALATSGNYRKFYEENGVRYSHTIDPKTGYPVQHAILSASVLANDCATADAYATAFMVMGFDNSIEILASDTSLEAYFIYSGTSDTLHSFITEGFKKIVLKEMK